MEPSTTAPGHHGVHESSHAGHDETAKNSVYMDMSRTSGSGPPFSSNHLLTVATTHGKYQPSDLMTWRKYDDVILGEASRKATTPWKEMRRKVWGEVRRD